MRIQSIILRNYRIHLELKVELDRQHTLIGGHNETGKSTLAEAAHRALFLKAKITGDTQKSMVSTIHAGHPEVELCFEAVGRSYRLLKRFSGVSGTTLLAEAEGVTLTGEDAESRLAEILGVAAAGGRNAGERVAEQWAHLWVWQGRAGDDPIKHANVQKDDLLLRLQSEGGAVVMQSELDAKIASKFNMDCEAMFTKNGGVKKDSELGRAANELQNSECAQQGAQQTSDKLQQVVRDFEEATSTIKSTESDLKRLHCRAGDIMIAVQPHLWILGQQLRIEGFACHLAQKAKMRGWVSTVALLHGYYLSASVLLRVYWNQAPFSRSLPYCAGCRSIHSTGDIPSGLIELQPQRRTLMPARKSGSGLIVSEESTPCGTPSFL